MGFDPRIETINANEAWLGSIPIHGWYDVRKPLVSTRNLVDIMPLTSIWSGWRPIHVPYYPPNTPALCYGATTGSTPWPLQSPVADTGHTAIRGTDRHRQERRAGRHRGECPRGPRMGRFLHGQGLFGFRPDQGTGRQHLDLGEEEVPLQPLARIDDPTDRMKIQGLLEDWIALQGVKLMPQQTQGALSRARTAGEAPIEQRTITNLITQVQDAAVRDGLTPYSLAARSGAFSMPITTCCSTATSSPSSSKP